jgi:integrase
MTTIRIRYVDRFVDRHGHPRHYFRRPGGPRIPLPGLPGSDEFISAYRAALDGEQSAPRRRGTRAGQGTFNRLALDYFASPDFLRLGPRTRYAYRLVIERFLGEHGHRLVREMRREDVKKIMAQKVATPGGANDLLKKIRALMKFAIDAELRTDDPTLRIKLYPEGEIHTWTDDEISQFEARWPIGTRERMAFALFLFTGQRKSDVVRMAWTDIVGKAIKVVQAKTGAKLTIALHPDLQ